MAEAAVAIVINKAVAAKALLEGEGDHLRENISWIETQMKTLQSYLKDAQSKKATNFINRIRDLALDLEDILDTCLPEIEFHKSKGSFGFLKHSSCTPCCGFTDNTLSSDIEKFKKRAAEIELSKGNITAESDNVDGKFREETNQLQNRIFGRKETFRKITEELLSGDQKCKLISIVGRGGVGKTTIAREIYDKVKNNFDCSAMVYVSEKSTLGDLLYDIARQVRLSENDMKHNMQKNLYHFLRSKRFVVFLDDVLDTSDVIDVLKDILVTDTKNRSRIIVTCRETKSSKSVFNLDLLSDSEGKELFYDSVEETLSPELKSIGDKIVQKCGGLPLAIQIAVGLLKTKERSKNSWNEVLERMNKDGENDSFKMILDLSYQDLPTKLKPFFLYFGIFPMNSEVFVPELIRFLVAEKLVQDDESRKADEIVEAYIDKLIARNLIQVSRRTFGGRVKSCGIQNRVHEFCTEKAEEINFFCNWTNLRNADLASTARRVVTSSSRSSSDQNNFEEDLTVPKKLRALVCFGKCRELAKFIKSYASELGFLRLLTIDVENIAINLPIEIANLSGLIYLKLKGQFITIPSSIGRMKKLETLEVRLREVPESVLKMKHLKHLLVSGVIMVKPRIRDRQHVFEVDLQNLETLDFDYQYGYHLSRSSFKKLLSLKKMKVSGAKKETLVDLSDAKKQTLVDLTDTTPLLQKLEELKLRVDSIKTSEIHTLNLSRYQNLRMLYVFFDSSVSITCTFEFPKNLVKITLGGIDIQDKDPLEKLGELPCLEIIKLKNCTARTIDISGHGKFPQLQVLVLCDTKFQRLLADEGGVPKLRKFIYKAHPQQPSYSKIPENLKKVMPNHDLISSSTSSDDDVYGLGRSWTLIRTLWTGFGAIKRGLRLVTGLIF